MVNSILLNDLSEDTIDKIVPNEKIKAGWTITVCWEESWLFTLTNGDDSSKTGFNCGAC